MSAPGVAHRRVLQTREDVDRELALPSGAAAGVREARAAGER
ncbi:hypothetical protein [Kitasatospora sp. NPDC054795]